MIPGMEKEMSSQCDTLFNNPFLYNNRVKIIGKNTIHRGSRELKPPSHGE